MQSEKKIVLPIKGMHCRSCEILLEDRLSEVGNVIKCAVSHKKGIAEIFYDDPAPNAEELRSAVVSTGYEIGEEERAVFINKNSGSYKELGAAFLLFIALYFFLKLLGFTDLNLNISSNPSGLGVVLLIGLVAGLSTCMVLVGGLLLGLSSSHAKQQPQATAAQKFRPHIFFNLGRVGGYFLFGGALGALGAIFHLSNGVTAFFTLFVGAVMIVIGLQLLELSPRLSSWRLTLPKALAGLLGIKRHQEYSHSHSATLGALTFFLPCGFTQAMQLYAISTGSFLSGALVMGAFALGTAPGLLSVGGITAAVKGRSARYFFKFAGIAVIFFAVINLSNGYNLMRLGFGSDPAQAKGNSDTIKRSPLILKMTESYRGYYPQQFKIKKDQPVRWEITAQDPYSCASSLIVPKLGIMKHLQAGMNIIEFTPTETGEIPFACSMGMFTGSFTVTN